MADPIQIDLTVDSDQLAEIGKAYMQDALPGWAPAPGNVETVLIEAAAQMLAEVAEQAALMPPEVYLTIAQTIYGIAPAGATYAQGTATFTWDASTPPMTVDPGTQIMAQTAAGDTALFSTLEAMAAPAGGGTTLSVVEAEESGPGGNDAFGAAELVSDIDGIASVTLDTTAGGADAETDDEYLVRVTTLLRVLAPRPILPVDHATLAAQVEGVGRVLVRNLYQPGTNDRNAGNAVGDWIAGHPAAAQTNIARCTTVAVTTESGGAPDATLLGAVYAALDANREVNFLNYAIKPTFTTVHVRATVVAYPGFNKDDAASAAAAQIAEWLDPATYGLAPDATDASAWPKDTFARLYEAVDYLNRATGVWYATNVLLSADGVTFTATDVPLTGAAPITRPGTITVVGQDAP